MKKGFKRFLRIGGLAAGGLLLLVALAVLLFLFDKPLVKSLAQKYLAKRAGIALKIGALDYDLFPLRVVLSSVKARYETPVFTLDVLVKRIEASGHLGQLLKGAIPVFERADIDIASLDLNQKKISETPIDFESAVLQTRDLLAYARRISIKCGGLEFSLPAQDFGLKDVRLSLISAGAPGTYGLVLDAGSADGATKDKRLALEGRFHAEGTLALARTTGVGLRLALDAPRFTSAGKTSSLRVLNIEVQGSWKTGQDSFSATKLALVAPGLMDITSSGAADFGRAVSMDLKARAGIESLEALSALLAPYLPPSLRESRIRGKTRIEAGYSLEPGKAFKEGKLEASIQLDGIKTDRTLSGLAIHGAASGLVKIAGTPADPRASGDIQASIGRLSRDGLDIRRTLVRLRAESSGKSVEIRNIEATLQGLACGFPGQRTIVLDEVRLKGSAHLDLARRSIGLTTLEARLPNLSPLRFSGRFDRDPGGVRQASLESRGLKIPALHALLAAFLPSSLSGWDFDGALDIGLKAGSLPDRKGVWEFSGDLAVSQAKFSDPLSSLAGDGLQPAVRIKGTYEPAQGVVDWTGEIELAQGESLLKDFYISWRDQPLKAEISGRFSRSVRAIDSLTARVTLPKIGEIHADGEARLGKPPAFQLRAGAHLSLEPLYALYSQTGVSPENRLRLSGALSGDFEIAKEGRALRIKGRLAVEDAGLENVGTQVAVRGIKADIPVNYLSGPALGTAWAENSLRASEKGEVQVQEIKIPAYTFPPISLSLHSLSNAYRIDPFSLNIFGALFEFGETALRIEPLTGAFHAGTSVKLPGFDLSRLKIGSSPSPLAGRARAEFPVLNITAAEITTTGRAEVDVFGGRVIIQNISASDPLAPDRAVSCDVDLEDLDLKKVTDVVPFGEVTGIIRGRIQGLTISYGQPESFDLILESVPRKGVAQTFSLKAVNSLTVLSSGQPATAASNPFWKRFIRKIHYQKIGIASTLNNDTFTLNGTIHEKGLEYLVKKPGLLGIDVINRMPESKVSFKDMLSRLERIGQSENPKAIK